MSNQDIEGGAPANGGAGAPAAPAGTPESLEQQLAKEREARTLMRDRLRHTEALAAESHALRSRMAQELERVTADRDRLRTAANAPAMGTASASTPSPSPSTSPPPMTPRASEWPLKPPEPPRRSGPWRALAMLGGLAAGVAALAWITGTMPAGVGLGAEMAGASAPAATASHVAAASAPVAVAAAKPEPTAAPASASPFPLPSGAVALPPLTPAQRLAAAPTAAGPAPAVAVAVATAPAGMATRLRAALDGEGISSPVDVDAATGHVMVADPQSDYALRDRTDLVIRSVYAGASLPEPQIEHRWLSPRRGDHVAQAAPRAAEPAPAPAPAQKSSISPAAAYAARHAAAEHHKGAEKTVADAEDLHPVVPAGRVTAGCMAGLSPKSTSRRADLTACMKHSCCASPGADECRAYEKAYPFTCKAG